MELPQNWPPRLSHFWGELPASGPSQPCPPPPPPRASWTSHQHVFFPWRGKAKAQRPPEARPKRELRTEGKQRKPRGCVGAGWNFICLIVQPVLASSPPKHRSSSLTSRLSGSALAETRQFRIESRFRRLTGRPREHFGASWAFALSTVKPRLTIEPPESRSHSRLPPVRTCLHQHAIYTSNLNVQSWFEPAFT